jgi:hypothetical protein
MDTVDAELTSRLLRAIYRCLVPIARLMLGAGLRYSQFEALARRAFVKAASEVDQPGKPANVSRIAVRTGLSRKLVTRLRDDAASAPIGLVDDIGQAARALQIWHTDPDFLDKHGQPLDLFFEADGVSFTELVRRVGGDVPAGAVRAELLAAGGVSDLSNGAYRVGKRFFVPAGLNEDLVVGFGYIVAPLLESLRHNVMDSSAPYLQRVAYTDHLPVDRVASFRDLTHEKAEEFLSSVDSWISANEAKEIDVGQRAGRIGIGVFYFQTDVLPEEK